MPHSLDTEAPTERWLLDGFAPDHNASAAEAWDFWAREYATSTGNPNSAGWAKDIETAVRRVRKREAALPPEVFAQRARDGLVMLFGHGWGLQDPRDPRIQSMRRLHHYCLQVLGDLSSEELAVHPTRAVSAALSMFDPYMPFLRDYKRYGDSKDYNPPGFHYACRRSLAITKTMIDGLQLRETDRDKLKTYLDCKDSSNNRGIWVAVKNGQVELVRLLMGVEPTLADTRTPPDFQDCNDMRNVKAALGVMFEHNATLLAKLLSALLAGYKSMETREDISENSLALLRFLVDKSDSESHVKDKTAMNIIASPEGSQVWEICSALCKPQLEGENCQLLHYAVKLRRVEIVKDIVTRYPQQAYSLADPLEGGEPKQYALWYCRSHPAKANGQTNGHSIDSADGNESVERKLELEAARKEIRKVLMEAVIRHQTVSEIQDLFRKCEITARQVCLQLSFFDTKSQDFAEYVKGLVTKERLEFEPVLRYASFPDLDYAFRALSHGLVEDSTEVGEVLNWLEKRRGVGEIVELKVLDRIHNAHDDDTVVKCIRDFKIRHLNWRKLDLYMGEFPEDAELETLHLYSSGNKAVISHWFSNDGGLSVLKKLKRLHIHIVADYLSEKKMETTFRFIKLQLQQLEAGSNNLTEMPTVEPYRWLQPKTIAHTKQNDLDEIGKAAIPRLACFIRRYRNIHKECEAKSTKVAIIDSGVVLVGGKRRLETDIPLHVDRVVSGMSFVHHKDGVEYPWWHAAGPHGTQMTSLVCAVDPRCDVYIARVTETDTSGVSAQRVADAILWAVKEQEVDVISLSLSLSDWSKELMEALQEAKRRDIVIVCATADEGNNTLNTSFAEYALAIAACDSYGKDLNWSQVAGVNYKLPGKDVSVGTVPFVESTEVISGSSVSTAIAAGLASLVLSCYRMAGNKRCAKGDDWRRSAVKARFDKMNLSRDSDSRDQYVRPWLLIGRDERGRSRIPEMDAECSPDFVLDKVNKYFGTDSPMDD